MLEVRAPHDGAETMAQVRVHGPDEMRIDEVPLPSVGPNDVLIRVQASGICGSDLGYIRAGGLGGVEPLKEPLPLGHEFAGVVAKVGDAVKDIPVGLRCAVNPDDGYIGGGGKEGALAPYILIPDAKIGSTLYPIPDDLPADRAALAEPLSVALHAVNIAKPAPGSKAVVLGAGPIGLSAIICLRHKGVQDIVAVDLSDARLERAKALGATHVINAARDNMALRLGDAHGTGERFGMPFVDTDVFIDTAGSLKALETVMDVVKYRAKLIIVALHKLPFPVNLWKMMANEVMISGSIAVARHAEFGECVDLLAAGEIDVGPLVSHRIGFDRVKEGFAVAADTDASAKVIITFPEPIIPA